MGNGGHKDNLLAILPVFEGLQRIIMRWKSSLLLRMSIFRFPFPCNTIMFSHARIGCSEIKLIGLEATMWRQQAELNELSTLMLISCLHIQSNLIFLHYRRHGKPRSPSMYIQYKVAICCLLNIKLHFTILLQFCKKVFISSIQKCCLVCLTKSG